MDNTAEQLQTDNLDEDENECILINFKQITMCNFALQMGNENLLSVAMACSDLLDKEIVEQNNKQSTMIIILHYCTVLPIQTTRNNYNMFQLTSYPNLYKTDASPRRTLWSGPISVHLIQVLLY